MKPPPKTRFDQMGKLNNAVVELIDTSQLTPLEVIAVLEAIASKIKELFALSTTKEKG